MLFRNDPCKGSSATTLGYQGDGDPEEPLTQTSANHHDPWHPGSHGTSIVLPGALTSPTMVRVTGGSP